MSEEIIIDDVNVAECEFLRHCVIPDNEGCKIDDSLCCDVGNCYYKQLKRLQAENEELKKQLEFSRTHKAVLDAERINYKQALEEIREYAKPVDELCKNCEHDRFLCDDECECNAYRLKQIDDKISEVLK